MSGKYLSLVIALGLLVGGCSSQPQHSSVPETSEEQHVSQEPQEAEQAEPSLSEVTLRRAMKEADFADRVEADQLIAEAPLLRIVLPSRLTRQISENPGRIGMWEDSEKRTTVVLSIAGIAGIASDGEKYAEFLTQAAQLSGRTVTYIDTVLFGEVSAHHFAIQGGSQLAEIYAFELDGISYELTLNAADEAALDEVRSHVEQTFAVPEVLGSSSGESEDGETGVEGENASGNEE
ncbi:hypothetical protein [Arcanobacterium pinnipediorum]|uniref:Lipoprotein LpqN n=1 Tax=Arcanobacterium pinnipediorum TaxID=1503041 RepID=A0ABY5AIA1_9ACTO|nr:hypothetical protein [Arcanobacterium pinnipediorum]USR79822.1 hypothetical protein NG665_02225 [Arcanobacterium pinnipediorum]